MAEENKAIEKLKSYKELFSKGYCKDCNELCVIDNFPSKDLENSIDIVLNLIETLQKENEKWKENARIAEENDTTLVLDVNQACKELGISEDTIIADELADKIKEKYILKNKIREIKNKNIGQYMNFYREIEKLLEEEQ